MKKIRNILLIIFFIFLAQVKPLEAKENVTAYLFYGEGCPHCKDLEEFLVISKTRDDNLNVMKFETWHSNNNLTLLLEVKKELDSDSSGVPFLVVGEKILTGFSNNERYRSRVIDMIETARAENQKDVVGELIGKRNELSEVETGIEEKTSLTIPNFPITTKTIVIIFSIIMIVMGIYLNKSSQK